MGKSIEINFERPDMSPEDKIEILLTLVAFMYWNKIKEVWRDPNNTNEFLLKKLNEAFKEGCIGDTVKAKIIDSDA